MADEPNDYSRHYALQRTLKTRVITRNHLPDAVTLVGGADVAYDEASNRMVGAIVVLDGSSLEVVETAYHEMDITFPYVPGLFSFREIPPLIAAFTNLSRKPEVIVCDGHGLAHPQGFGMATHLGVELQVPTVGCAKKRLCGAWRRDELGAARGSTVPLHLADAEIGKVLRTRAGVKPVFVSVGHKVDLTTATDLVLRLCPKYRLPETTRRADQLVNRLRKRS